MSKLFEDSYEETNRESDKETSEVLKKAGESILFNTKNLFNSLSKRTGALFGSH